MEVEQIIKFRIEFGGMTDEKIVDHISNHLDNYFSNLNLLIFLQQGINFIEGFIDYSQRDIKKIELIEIFKNEISRISRKIEIKNCG